MAIGDDLFTLLGLVPSRDRAGIARGTMADEAKASVAANSGNAEGRALVDQGARPPDFELPADIPTAYAAGKQRAAPYGGPSVIPSVIPPAPSERVVASGPAAAPPPAVVRNSDIILSAMQRQAQAARMQQIIGSIGMIANAFNRNPDSQASTKASLAGMMGGGGGGAAGGGDVGTLAKLLEMRDAETATERMVDQAKRMFGLSEQDARARAATGELTKLFDPKTIATREADQRAARVRMDLSDPAVIAEIAKRTGSPEAVVKADIASGKIGQKEIADILHTQAQSGKLGAETGALTQKTEEERKSNTAFAFYKDNPEAFARLHRIPLEEAQSIVSDRKNYDKYQETSGPTAYAAEAGYAAAKRGGYKGTREEWQTLATPKQVESPEDKAYGHSLTKQVDEFAESQKSINERVNNMTGARALQEASLSDDLIVGSKLSGMTLDARKIAAKALGYADTAAEKTDVFKKTRDAQALQLQQVLKGQTSNADVEWLKGIAGSDEMSVASIRRLMLLQDRADRVMIEQHNKRLDEAAAGKGGKAYAGFRKVNYPPPGPLLTDFLRSKPQDIAAIKAADPADKEMQSNVREKYGPGVFEFVKEHM